MLHLLCGPNMMIHADCWPGSQRLLQKAEGASQNNAQVGFYRGDVLLLLEDIEELQPTLFTSVPRLYNRIYDKVWEDAASCSCALSVCHTHSDIAPLPASSGAPPATRL